MGSEVTDLITALRAGTMTLDEVARRFRERTWPEPEIPASQTYLELAAAALQDPEPDIPNSIDDVTASYDRGELTRVQYRTLVEAAADSINTEERRVQESRQGRTH